MIKLSNIRTTSRAIETENPGYLYYKFEGSNQTEKQFKLIYEFLTNKIKKERKEDFEITSFNFSQEHISIFLKIGKENKRFSFYSHQEEYEEFKDLILNQFEEDLKISLFDEEFEIKRRKNDSIFKTNNK